MAIAEGVRAKGQRTSVFPLQVNAEAYRHARSAWDFESKDRKCD
jgi:hypothetical protein